MQTTESTTPANLLQALSKKPLTKDQLMSYLAHLQVYGEFQVQEAKRSNLNAEHPFHTEPGRESFLDELTLIQDVFADVQRDLRNHRITLQTHEMRRVDDMVKEANVNFVKAMATYHQPLQAPSGVAQ